MTTRINRRRFFASTGAAASLAFLADAVLPSESASAASLYVRRNVGGMNAYDPVITSYRKAIKAMRERQPPASKKAESPRHPQSSSRTL